MIYELYVNKKRVDLLTDTTITLSYQYINIDKIFDYTDTYSKTITIPLTINNKTVFGLLDRTDKEIKGESGQTGIYFNPSKENYFILFANGDELLTGTIQINTIKSKEIEVTLSGSLSLLFNKLKDITIYDIIDFDTYIDVVVRNHFKEGAQENYNGTALSTLYPNVYNKFGTLDVTSFFFNPNLFISVYQFAYILFNKVLKLSLSKIGCETSFLADTWLAVMLGYPYNFESSSSKVRARKSNNNYSIWKYYTSITGQTVYVKDILLNYFKTYRCKLIYSNNTLQVFSPSDYFNGANVYNIPFTLESFEYIACKYKTITFKTKKANSKMQEIYNNDYDTLPYGSCLINVGSNGTALTYEVPMEMCHFALYNYINCDGNVGTGMAIENKSNKAVYNKGSFFYATESTGTVTGYVPSWGGYSGGSLEQIGYGTNQTIFSEPKAYFDDGTLKTHIEANGTIYTNRWKNLIDTLFNGSSKIIKGKAIISPFIWNKLKVAPVFFRYDNNLLFLNKISDYDINKWQKGTSVECFLVNKIEDMI